MKIHLFPAWALLLSFTLGGCIPTATEESEVLPSLDAGDDDTSLTDVPTDGDLCDPDPGACQLHCAQDGLLGTCTEAGCHCSLDCPDEGCQIDDPCFSNDDCAGPLVEAVSGCQRSEPSDHCGFYEDFTVTLLRCDLPADSTGPGTCQVEAQTSDSRPCRPDPGAVISAHQSCASSCDANHEEPRVGRCIFQGPDAGACDCQECFIHSDCAGPSQCCGENQCFTAEVSCLDL